MQALAPVDGVARFRDGGLGVSDHNSMQASAVRFDSSMSFWGERNEYSMASVAESHPLSY